MMILLSLVREKSRTTWGTTSPTNPMMPVTETREATTTDTTMNITERNSLTRRPMAAASSSPIIIILNREPMRVKVTVPTVISMAGMVSVFHCAAEMAPICQLYTAAMPSGLRALNTR